MEDCSTDERLQQETLCHRQWTDEYVERPETLMRQNVVVPVNYSVSQKKLPLRFSDIFPKRLGIFSPNFTYLLQVPIYARLQIFVQLFATLTKLCHIKRDHPVPIICSMSTIGRNARVQMFAKVIDRFADRYLWQVITDLLQCTF